METIKTRRRNIWIGSNGSKRFGSFKCNACENEGLKDINTDINSCEQGNERQTTYLITGVDSWEQHYVIRMSTYIPEIAYQIMKNESLPSDMDQEDTVTIKGVSWPVSKGATPWAFE